MRTARIITRLPPLSGGKEIHGAALSHALRCRALDDRLYWQLGELPAEGAGVRRRASSDLSRLQLMRFSAWAVLAVARAHRTRPFDLVHAHGDFVEAAAAGWLARQLRIPALLSVHGALSETRAHRAFRVAAYGRMDRIFVASLEISRQIKDSGIEVPTIVRPSGVREPFFKVQRQPDAVPTVLTVARLSPVKGLEALIAARDKLLDRDIRWVVAAGGDGDYAERLRTEIARRSNMRLVYAHSAEELAQLHARAHLFVLPSIQLARQEEGLPTALMEAIASRTPVIATATGGVARVLRDGAYGLTVPPGDADALAHAIRNAIANPRSMETRATEATRAGVAEPWDVVAEQIHAEYVRVLDAPRSTSRPAQRQTSADAFRSAAASRKSAAKSSMFRSNP